MTALVVAVEDAGSNGAVLVQESGINQAPEVEVATRSLLDTALINTGTIIPSVTDGLQGAVERRERRQQTNVVAVVIAFEGVLNSNVEGVTITGNTEDDLVGRHACTSPCAYGVDGTAALVGWGRTSVIQRSVGGDSG